MPRMTSAEQGNPTFIGTLIFSIFLALQISGGFAQTGQLNVDSKTHSTFSNVTGNFVMTLVSSTGYRFSWRFNESNICTAAVNIGPTLIPSATKCDPAPHAAGSNEKYYAANSQISATISSGVITLELLYSMALLEEYPLRMDVYDTATNRLLSKIVYITVQNCTKNTGGIANGTVLQNPSASCDYLCSAPVVCAEGYSNSSSSMIDLKAICQANNTWGLNGPSSCESITCTVETCENCCYSDGKNLPQTVVLGYSETLDYKCCDGSNPESFKCTDGGNHTLELKCSSSETTQPTTVSDPYITSGSVTGASSIETGTVTRYNSTETTQPTAISDAYVTSDSITGRNSTETGMFTEEFSAEPVSVTGAININSSTDGMSPGDLAGIVLTFLVVTIAIIVVVVTLKLYPTTSLLNIVYGVVFTVCFAGILMCFLGSSGGSELNGVEIAGIVLASVGTVAAVGALVFQIVQGKNGKNYFKGSTNH